MKLAQFRKLIREEVRKSIAPKKRSRLNESVQPAPLDSTVTSQLVFIPVSAEDMDYVIDGIAGTGDLQYSIFLTDGSKTGVIVKKSEARDAVELINDVIGSYND